MWDPKFWGSSLISSTTDHKQTNLQSKLTGFPKEYIFPTWPLVGLCCCCLLLYFCLLAYLNQGFPLSLVWTGLIILQLPPPKCWASKCGPPYPILSPTLWRWVCTIRTDEVCQNKWSLSALRLWFPCLIVLRPTCTYAWGDLERIWCFHITVLMEVKASGRTTLICFGIWGNAYLDHLPLTPWSDSRHSFVYPHMQHLALIQGKGEKKPTKLSSYTPRKKEEWETGNHREDLHIFLARTIKINSKRTNPPWKSNPWNMRNHK